MFEPGKMLYHSNFHLSSEKKTETIVCVCVWVDSWVFVSVRLSRQYVLIKTSLVLRVKIELESHAYGRRRDLKTRVSVLMYTENVAVKWERQNTTVIVLWLVKMEHHLPILHKQDAICYSNASFDFNLCV